MGCAQQAADVRGLSGKECLPVFARRILRNDVYSPKLSQ